MQTKNTKQTIIQPVHDQDGYFPPLDDQTLLEPIFDAAKKISPYALYELATDPYPPKVVQEVVEAVCMLLGIQADWNAVKKLIEHEKLAKMIQEFHPESVPDIYLEQISAIANLQEMQIVNLEKQSLATGQLGEWIHAIAIYYDIKHKPMIYSFMCEPEQIEPELAPVQNILDELKKEEPKKEEPKKEVPPPPRIVSIKEALESIKNLNKQDIVEVRSYKKPPGGVLLVLEALCILFDSMKMEKKGYNQIVYEPNYRKLLENTDAFIRKVLTWDYDKIPKDKVKKLREYIVKPEFELEKVKKASVAAASFSLLIISIVQKFDQPQANQATA